MKTGRILLVDDEPIALDNLRYILEKEGYDVITTNNGNEAISLIKENELDLVLTDLRMPETDGMQVLDFSRHESPDTEVIMITGYATIDSAIGAMKLGAYHYITKPYKIDEVRTVVNEALTKRALKRENRALKANIKKLQSPEFITTDPGMEEILSIAQQVAYTDCSILITGESGTGKELLAHYIHNHSNRKQRPFVTVNCGAFNSESLSEELFGTGSKESPDQDRGTPGSIRLADGGTLFLDEITEIAPALQVKLLEVMQEKEITGAGNDHPQEVDVRFIAASNRNIELLTREGKFRKDLFFRLNVVNLHLPPLVERKRDVPGLINTFIDKYNTIYQNQVTGIEAQALNKLQNYSFPGNIRELEHIVERAVVLARTGELQLHHLPDLSSHSYRNNSGRLVSLEEYEQQYIEWVMKKCRGKKTRAAEILGIDRVSLWRKLKKYGYQVDTPEKHDHHADENGSQDLRKA